MCKKVVVIIIVTHIRIGIGYYEFLYILALVTGQLAIIINVPVKSIHDLYNIYHVLIFPVPLLKNIFIVNLINNGISKKKTPYSMDISHLNACV